MSGYMRQNPERSDPNSDIEDLQYAKMMERYRVAQIPRQPSPTIIRRPPPLKIYDQDVNRGAQCSGDRYTSEGMDSTLYPMVSPPRSLKPRFMYTYCAFCHKNGELEKFYNSHTLKDENGKTTCPVLMRYICPLCNASGVNAHTTSYCPKSDRRRARGSIPSSPNSVGSPPPTSTSTQYTWTKEGNSHNAAWTGSGIRRVAVTGSKNESLPRLSNSGSPMGFPEDKYFEF
ncbi:unnamed protein product [Lepeophtheirus salmonis]|uniref:(salmon louse) hypothetical protein n=1 Tax=Lepeophtheirus salmonis TaxID=72036 RepID=A0A7R8H675_LEPSM|nr:nanos homolog 3-like [Lepeophtheirus salmonis]CAB4061344.1 unnamed protein product [Lepeophtheirus salmonis]CAF2882849.1 unnamed protein product [Lepeophtheirus salmonis]